MIFAPPNVTDYTTFLRDEVGIPSVALPDNSFPLTTSLAIAQEIVSCWLNWVESDIYVIAVYNLAADRLIHIANDQSGQAFFENARKSYGIGVGKVLPGFLTSSYDETTGETLTLSQSMQNLSLSDLSNMQTPYGQQYLMFAQMLGSLWGLS